MSEFRKPTEHDSGTGRKQLRSDQLVAKVRMAVEVEREKIGWTTQLHESALELCTYHLEMRDHALRCEAAIHRMTK